MRMLPLLLAAGCLASRGSGPAHPAAQAHAAKPSGASGDSAAAALGGRKAPPQRVSPPPEEAHRKGSAPAKAMDPEPTGHPAPEKPESGDTPSVRPRPDTAFARAKDWEEGQAEILEYAVKRPGPEGEGRCRGRLVTERLFLRPEGTTARSRDAQDEAEILNAALAFTCEAGGSEFSVETVDQFPREGAFALLRQEQGLQGPDGTTHRSLDCRAAPPRMRVASSGGETPRDTALARWPVYTEEMLFTYLRAIPQRAGYREEVWLQDWGPEGRLSLKPRFASLVVRARAPGVRDMDTWYVTVDRDDGRRSEFWVAANGLHPVVVANLAEGTEWTLLGISRRPSPAW